MSVIQRNIRNWIAIKDWQWYKLYLVLKPKLASAQAEDEMKAKEAEYEKTKEELKKIVVVKKELEEINITLSQAKSDLAMELKAEEVSHLYIIETYKGPFRKQDWGCGNIRQIWTNNSQAK